MSCAEKGFLKLLQIQQSKFLNMQRTMHGQFGNGQNYTAHILCFIIIQYVLVILWPLTSLVQKQNNSQAKISEKSGFECQRYLNQELLIITQKTFLIKCERVLAFFSYISKNLFFINYLAMMQVIRQNQIKEPCYQLKKDTIKQDIPTNCSNSLTPQNLKPSTKKPVNQNWISPLSQIKIKKYQQMNYHTELKNIIVQIYKNDFSYLLDNAIVIILIQNLVQFKNQILSVVREDVKVFLDLISARITVFPYSRLVHKELLQATKKLEKAYSYQGNRRNVAQSQHQTDRIFKEFVRQMQTKARRQSSYYVEGKDKNKAQIGEYMTKVSEFFKDNKWRDILFITKHAIELENLQEQKPDNPEIVKIQRKMDFNKTIQRQNLMNVSCLGCTNHFIKNWNFLDQSVNKVKFVLGGSALNFIHDKDDSTNEEFIKLKRSISGLMNSRGGAILYGCQQRYLDVVAKGQYFIKSYAQKFIEKIGKAVQQIKPSPIMGQNIIISFIPVLKDLITESNENLLQPNKKFENQFSGLYVARIVVRPTKKQTYCYGQNQKLLQTFIQKSLLNDERPIGMKSFEPTQLKTVQNSPQQNSDNCQAENCYQDWINDLLFSAQTDFDHEQCQIPSHGANIPREMKEINEKSTQLNIEDVQKQFKYATGLVIKPQNFQEFKRRLQRYNLQHFIEYGFPHSRIKGANATAILYHNLTHPQIKQMISLNSVFQFDGRNTISVPIVDHIKLISRLNRNVLPVEQLNNLQLWIDSEFKGEEKCRIQMLTVKNEYKESQYFLKIIGNKAVKKCILFTYLLTNHFNQKSQLRNPKILK